MWVLGQLYDGSHGSWVTNDDPFPSLIQMSVVGESGILSPVFIFKKKILLFSVPKIFSRENFGNEANG